MSNATQREWQSYLEDMIGFAEKVIAYTEAWITTVSSPMG